jgi:transcriptional regulator with XRE-family HTH domain
MELLCVMKPRRLTKDELLERFADRLNEALTLCGVPHHGRAAELARLTGMTHQGASKWLDGDGYPSMANMTRIAAHYGISLHWLATGDGIMLYLGINEEERTLIEHFRLADERGKKRIRATVEQEAMLSA